MKTALYFRYPCVESGPDAIALSTMALEQGLIDLGSWRDQGGHPSPTILVVGPRQASTAFRLSLAFDKTVFVVVDGTYTGLDWALFRPIFRLQALEQDIARTL